MRYYLSSYKIGNQADRLKQLTADRTLGFIPNASDWVTPQEQEESNQRNMKDVTDLGIRIEILDLKDYFENQNALQEKMNSLGGVWVKGGNTFVLRQAMRLSGFDTLIKHMPNDFLYAGFSAGVCVLAPTLYALQQVDDPKQNPYNSETIWDGLHLLDYIILPHYKSDHPESADIDKEVEYCKQNNIPYKTLKDGEVIIIE